MEQLTELVNCPRNQKKGGGGGRVYRGKRYWEESRIRPYGQGLKKEDEGQGPGGSVRKGIPREEGKCSRMV